MKKYRAFGYSLLGSAIVLGLGGGNIIVSGICFAILFFSSKVLFAVYDEAGMPEDNLEKALYKRDELRKEELNNYKKEVKEVVSEIFTKEQNIENEDIKSKVADNRKAINKILEKIESKHISEVRSFFDYYIPEINNIIGKYLELQDIFSTDNVKIGIEDELWKTLKDFETDLNSLLEILFADDIDSIKSDINVLRNSLKTEGLNSQLTNKKDGKIKIGADINEQG